MDKLCAVVYMVMNLQVILLLLPLALQPTVGSGLLNNVLPFFPICHQLSPSSHSLHLKISFRLFLGLNLLLIPSSSWVKIFLGILSSSILSRWPNLCPFIHFTIFSPLLISSSSRFRLDSQGCEILYKVCLWQQRWNQEPERNRCKKGLPRCIVCYWPCAILKSPCLGRQGRQVR